jgi:hypothetical protein
MHEYLTSFISTLVVAGCAWEIHKQCPEEKELKLYRAVHTMPDGFRIEGKWWRHSRIPKQIIKELDKSPEFTVAKMIGHHPRGTIESKPVTMQEWLRFH